MSEELTPEQKFAAEDAETMLPRALREGRDPEQVVAELVRLDWRPEVARALVARVAEDLRRYDESPESRAELVREAKGQLTLGVILVLAGVVVTGFTFLAALSGALPVIVVAWGLVLGGAIVAWRGWARWRLYR